MTGKVSISLAQSQKQIEGLILRELVKIVEPIFKNSVEPVKDGTREIIYSTIIDSEEMRSLREGVLRWDFGLTTGQAENTVEIFARGVSESVDVKLKTIKFTGKTASGGLVITVQPNSFENIPEILVPWKTEGETPSVNDLLLKYGDGFVIFDYDIDYGSFKGSRSGGARMVESKASSWGVSTGLSRVPPQYAGNPSDNFITRAIDNKNTQSQIEKVILSTLGKQ